VRYLAKEDKLTIDLLKKVGSTTKKKLKDAGLIYLKDILMYHPSRLVELTGMSEDTANKVIEEAIEIIESEEKTTFGLLKASKIAETLEKRKFLHTGSRKLDEILMGGYAVGEVTELAGEYRTGKSQACYTALATAFLPPEEGGLNDGDIGVVLIDAEKTFNPKRMDKIFQRFDLDPKYVLDRTWVGRPKSTIHQKKMIDNLVKVVKEYNVKLVIVDSLTKLPRADFAGRGELYDRQRYILSMVETLRRLADTYQLVVLVTNQVVAVPDTSFVKTQIVKPIGGHVLAHTVDTRLFLSPSKENTRWVEIWDSSWLPPAKTKIMITEAGIADPVEK